MSHFFAEHADTQQAVSTVVVCTRWLDPRLSAPRLLPKHWLAELFARCRIIMSYRASPLQTHRCSWAVGRAPRVVLVVLIGQILELGQEVLVVFLCVEPLGAW